MIVWDNRGDRPLYQQIYEDFARQIETGVLREGQKLPSKRALTERLNVSMTTVENAYEMLVGEGYVAPRSRRGYWVEKVLPVSKPQPAVPKAERTEAPSRFDFSTGAVDAQNFPFAALGRLMRKALSDTPMLLGVGDAQGDLPLRRALLQFLQDRRGVTADVDQLIIGAGQEMLLGMLFQLFDRQTLFAQEDPGYQGVYRVAKAHARKVIPLPVDEQGLQPRLLAQSGVRAAFVTPSHQFPMGTTMPISRRTALLRWAEENGGYLIEDDYDSEFRYLSRPIPSLQGLDGGERVVYMGTFSRILAPSMRMAYMILPPKLLSVWQGLFGQSAGTVSRFEQQSMAAFIGGGHMARHLRRVGKVYRRRVQTLCSLLRAGLPQAHIVGREGGLHFVLMLPGMSEQTMQARLAAAGMRVSALGAFARLTPQSPGGILVGFAGLKDSEVEAAAAALTDALKA